MVLRWRWPTILGYVGAVKRLGTIGWVLLLCGACQKTGANPVGDMASPQESHRESGSRSEGLAHELMRQAQDRPEATPKVEDVLSAFGKAGISITRSQQVLASPLHAHFCVAASTADGMGLSICEFDDAARAEAGRLLSQKAMKGRTFALREKTLLTVIGPEPGASRLVHAFESVSAR